MSKIILLDNIRSMQNIGAIFRNCDGAGFEKLIVTGYSPHPPRSDISKTALGAENWVDWEYFFDPLIVLKDLKSKGYHIYGVELTADAIPYTELFKNCPENICLIMGNEVDGIDQKLLDFCDKKIIIPMNGNKESLNVSVAAGIVMYACQSG